MCVGFLVLNKKIDNTDDREKMLSCLYSPAYITVWPVHTIYCISYLNFPMWHLKNFPNSFKWKQNAFPAYTYASPWKSQKLRDMGWQG